MFVSAVQQRESALSVHLSPSCTALLSPPHATPLGRHGAPGYISPCAVLALHSFVFVFVFLTLSETVMVRRQNQQFSHHQWRGKQ